MYLNFKVKKSLYEKQHIFRITFLRDPTENIHGGELERNME